MYYVLLKEIFGILPQQYVSTISTNGPLWMALSILSLLIESAFVVELGVRMWAGGPFDYLSNGWNVLDALIVLALIPLKLCLPTGQSLVAGFLVILRCWRFIRYTKTCVKRERKRGESLMKDIIKDANAKIAKEKSVSASYYYKLNAATSKLNKLLGYVFP